ncbi:MAG: transketolase C-terminal domain-containing protein [Pseudomonadota bacterium]
MTAVPVRPTYESTLGGLARDNDRIVVLTAENRAVIRRLPEQLGPRFIDVGICEQTMIGMAAGLALRGRVPIVHALATFLTLRAFEFIRTDVGIAGLPVKLIGGVAGLLSEANGPTHQALDDLALMRTIPGMAIVCPADEDDLCAALPCIVESSGPVYVRHNPRATTRAHEPFVFGRAERMRTGGQVTILALGLLVAESMEAAAMLGEDGISVGVISVRTLFPIDEAAVLAAARNAHLLVTVEDHFLVGGLYQTVSEILFRHGLSGTQVLPIGFDARFFAPGLLPDVLRYEGLTGSGLAERIAEAWDRRRAGQGAAIAPSPNNPPRPPGPRLLGGLSLV